MKQETLGEVTLVPIDDLNLHPDNPRQGDVGAIATSIERNGWFGSLVAQVGSGRVLVGNHRLQAARQLGFQELPVHWVDVDEVTARRILLADNRTSDLASYNDTDLVALLQAQVEEDDLIGTGWDAEELDDLLAEIKPPFGSHQFAEGEKGDPRPENPSTSVGDLIVMGEHRLVCGDSFDQAVWEQLLEGQRPGAVFTDPPYGMNLATDYKAMHTPHSGTYAPVIGDDDAFDAAPLFEAFADVKEQFWWGADYYRDTIPSGGSWVVWDKRENEWGADLDKVFGAQFELCWSRQAHRREIARIVWSGINGLAAEDTRTRIHPTQKPTLLVRWFFDRWVKDGATVLDLFGGSGSTLIACEQTDRKARMVELDRGYCDVIVDRWEKLTGLDAVRP